MSDGNDLMSEVRRVVKVCVDKCGMTAAQVTTELTRAGLLPNGWTVVEVANYIRDFDILSELKARLPAGWSPERFDKLLDDDIAEQSQQSTENNS